MIKIRRSNERGFFDHGWLKTFHTFSFAEYVDPNHKEFKGLRVINEDFIAPGKGFGTHFHRDMNILTFIVDGCLQHQDSMGNGSIIKKGEWQFMSAGSGVEHSEVNPSSNEEVHLLQIWIKPNANNLPPRYSQLEASPNISTIWRAIAHHEENEGQIRLEKKASIHHVRMQNSDKKMLKQTFGSGFWIQMILGTLKIDEHLIKPGDGASIEGQEEVLLEALTANTEFVLFELGV